MEHHTFDHLDTTRLHIRRFRADDVEAFAEYRNQLEVARFQGWDVPYPIAAAKEFVDGLADLSPGRPGTWFQFAVCLGPHGSLIGDCALRTSRVNERQAELGFSFAAGYQRQGFAAEAVSCVLTYAFTTLMMHRVFAMTDTRNERAQRLLSRVGFRREGHFIENTWFKGEWASEFLYAQLASEWTRSQSG